MWDALIGFAFGALIAGVTTPVGVSGAVFLLPVQLSVLGIPSPTVTPTNLLFNVVSVPGALTRFARRESLRSTLAVRMLVGTIPGVVVGAIMRVFLLPGETVFRGLLAVLLIPLGLWLALHQRDRQRSSELAPAVLVGLGFAAGFIGGVYGIGGGSLLAPVLVASGYAIATVAPAALLTTFATSCVGVVTYVALASAGHEDAAPDWLVGLSCGLGGLLGGVIGASLQPRLPIRGLRTLLGILAVALGCAYIMVLIRT